MASGHERGRPSRPTPEQVSAALAAQAPLGMPRDGLTRTLEGGGNRTATVTLFSRQARPHGRPITVPRDRLVAQLVNELRSMPFAGQIAVKTFERGYRSRDTFEVADGIALDVEPHPRRDVSGDEAADALEVLAQYAQVLHATPRGARGFVLLTRPVGAEELRDLARGINAALAPRLPKGWAADGSNMRTAQVWRGPRMREVEAASGVLLDPAELPKKRPPAPPRTAAPTPPGGLEVGPRWVEARIAAVCRDLQAAPEGQRADAAFTAGLKLGSVAHLLDEAEAKGALMQAAMSTGLRLHEARDHLKRGWATGARKPRNVRMRGTR